MVRRGVAVCLLLAGLASSACHTRIYAPDGGADATPGDAVPADVPGTLALDFAATGCARLDPDAGTSHADGGVTPCMGTPPLTLTFAPVSSAALTRFRWTFGDGSAASTDRAPTHTYTLPGTYDVSLVAEGAVGSVSRAHVGFVEVTSALTGAPCDVDAQCGPDLFCLCGQGAPCADPFTRGVCARACPAAGCGERAACARVDVTARAVATSSDASPDGVRDAATGDAPDAPAFDAADGAIDGPRAADAPADAPFTSDSASDRADAATADGAADASQAPAAVTPVCLAACASDADCPTGLGCRTLPGTAGAGSWASVCVPPSLRRVGEPCRDAEDRLDDQLCATGVCTDLGAIGLCSASCAGGAACPSGAACATFGDGRALCLATCSTSAPCARDPLLDCETAAGVGALGFLTSPPAPTATFCAPRTCTSGADCSPSGTCKPLGVGAHCVGN
jgi:PKD repeat protein